MNIPEDRSAQDAALVSRFMDGDRAAFGELYDAYVKKIYAFVYYRCFHRETAEDVCAVAFAKALEKIHTFRGDKGNFSGWLYTIARNALADHFRSERPTDELEEAEMVSDGVDVAGTTDDRERLSKVRAFLETLPEDQREVVRLRLWDDLAYEDIAVMVGKKPEHCKVIFSRAMAKVRANPELLLAVLFIRHFINHQ